MPIDSIHPRFHGTVRILAGAVTLAVTAAVGCGPSSEPDPRCRINAQGEHRREIAKAINASGLWQEYLDQVRPSTAGGSPVVEFHFNVERSTRKSYGGDYDPGQIAVDFKAKTTSNGRTIYKNEMEVRLGEFMIGRFTKDTPREEIQEAAFKATEEKVYPYLNRWVNLSAIRAMGSDRATGSVFVPTLNKLIDERWTSDDMRAAAREVLRGIKGSG